MFRSTGVALLAAALLVSTPVLAQKKASKKAAKATAVDMSFQADVLRQEPIWQSWNGDTAVGAIAVVVVDGAIFIGLETDNSADPERLSKFARGLLDGGKVSKAVANKYSHIMAYFINQDLTVVGTGKAVQQAARLMKRDRPLGRIKNLLVIPEFRNVRLGAGHVAILAQGGKAVDIVRGFGVAGRVTMTDPNGDTNTSNYLGMADGNGNAVYGDFLGGLLTSTNATAAINNSRLIEYQYLRNSFALVN